MNNENKPNGAGVPEIFEPEEGLFLIDLPQSASGFRRFISSWFFRDALGRRIVVDPGPTSSLPLLESALERLTDDVDLVLITHIHLDHSGCIGEFCDVHPHAKVLVHPRGATHLRSPGKLWSASVRTLGGTALMYGEPRPLPAETEIIEEDAEGVIEVFMTPGHAPHHISMRVKDDHGRSLLFVGEAAGTICPSDDGRMYIRPASPPVFDAKSALDSMTTLRSILRGDEILCFGHWGAVRNPSEQIAAAERQTREWLDVIARIRAESAGEDDDAVIEKAAKYFFEHDPMMGAELPDDLRERERIFLGNNIRGMLKYTAEHAS